MKRGAEGWRRAALAASLVVVPALLLSGALSLVPAMALSMDPQSYSACDHVLRAAGQGAGPEVECFLNATGQLTFSPNQLSIPANSTVIFSVGNIGGMPHTFTLDRVANDSQLATWTQNPSAVPDSQLQSYFANHSLVNLVFGSGSGPYTSNATHMPAPHGIFWFVCLVSGHFRSGMFGAVYEGLAPPVTTISPTITSTVQAAIIIVAFVVLGAAAILIIIGRSHGHARTMKTVETQATNTDPGNVPETREEQHSSP